MKVVLRRGLNDTVARSGNVTAARQRVAAEIASDAADRSRITRAKFRRGGAGGSRKGTFRAEVDTSQDPPRVAAVAGNKRDKSFIVIFEEFGGSGFRPPPAPMRTAAEKYGRIGR